jgi:palmitoyltransferase
MLGYHAWLVYCGTTTNEAMKWSDWQVEMDEGFAYKRRLGGARVKDAGVEPTWTRWPAEAEQVLVRTEDGQPPAPGADLPGYGAWEAVWRLRDVENLYDLGFWDNLLDVFIPGFMFRDPHVPAAEGKLRRRKKRRARKIYLA